MQTVASEAIWLRISDLASYTETSSPDYYWKDTTTFTTWSLFGTDVEPIVMTEGALNDCYFLAALSAVSEDSDRLQSMFLTDELNDQGIQAVRLFIKGIPTTYVVDDYLPFLDNGDGTFSTAFSGISSEGGFWSPILEKAWAKLNGNYELAFTGQVGEALKVLTGAPTQTYVMTEQSTDDAWYILSDALDNAYIVAADTWGTGDDQQENDFGMLLSHSYTVLGAYEVTDGDDTYQLLQMRDPWTTEATYTGAFNNSDALWTDELMSQVPYQTDDLSLFFMDVETFVLAFRRYAVNQYKDSWVLSYMELLDNNHNSKSYTYELASHHDSFTVSVDLLSSRMFACQSGESYVWMSVADE